MSEWRVDVGDALAWLASLPDGSVDAVVTDPPYSSGGAVRSDRIKDTRSKYQSSDVKTTFESFSGDNRDQRAFGYWCSLWLSECRRITKPGGMLCVFTDWRQLPTVTDVVQSGGWIWRGIVVWDKVVARPVADRFRGQAEYVVWSTNGPRDAKPRDDSAYGEGVIRERTPVTKDRVHATQKPVGVLRKIIDVASPVGGVVVDPFVGSGSTGIACVQSGRNFWGCEMSEHYADIARGRIEHEASREEPCALTT